MNIGERLRQERERLGLSQPVFGEIGGVQKLAQSNYEQGKRAPDADYLAAVAASGVDVRYVVTGERDYTPPPALSAEEQTMLEYFRQATPAVRRAALGALIGAAPTHPSNTTVYNGPVAGVAGRDVIHHGTTKRKK